MIMGKKAGGWNEKTDLRLESNAAEEGSMKRDEKMELIAHAKERAKARTAMWLADPEVRTSLQVSERAIREMKAVDEPRKRA